MRIPSIFVNTVLTLILSALFFSVTSGQPPSELPLLPPFSAESVRVKKNGDAAPLRLALVKDDENDDYQAPWYLGIGSGEIVEIEGDCTPVTIANTVTETCFQLFTDRPDIVGVVNNRYLVGIGQRGEANIWMKRVQTVTTYAVGAAPVKALTISDVSIPIGGVYRSVNSLRVRVSSNTDRRVVAIPSMKTFKQVKDTYGRRIANNYVVIKVNVVNSNIAKQFLIQNVSIAFDPNQCEEQEKNWPGFDESACDTKYVDYFKFPVAISPTDSDTMLAVASAERYRSPRYKLFQGIKFFADVGGALTAFKILGPDGVTGFNFLGGTLASALDVALPKISEEKKKNLENDIPKKNIIVKGNDDEEVNVFIPADRVFSSTAWKSYQKTVGKVEDADTEFKRYMLLFLVAKASGVLIDENSKQVESKTGGGAKRL